MATDEDFRRIGNYAVMYNKDKNIDRRGLDRTVPMEVLCLGYSRTGSLSMQKALSILGYRNPYHFSSLIGNVKECDLWMEAISAKFYGKGELPDKAFWDGLLGHSAAVTDAPCILFAHELLECYPDAKVVLVERELNSWFESWMAFCEPALSPAIRFVGQLDPQWAGRISQVGHEITSIESGFAKNIDEARVRSKNAYVHHYQDVRMAVEDERLLEFRLQQGWEPLCKFLGKPVPDVDFPHENEKIANQAFFREFGRRNVQNILKTVIKITGLGMLFVTVGYWPYTLSNS